MTVRAFLTSLACGAMLASSSRAFAQGCAMCGGALGDDPLGRALSWSVIFLMAAPYAIFGTIGGWLYLTYRRASGRHRAAVIDLAATGRRSHRSAPGDGSEGDIS